MNEAFMIKKLQQGNKKVFSTLVDDYKNKIFSMAYKFTNDYCEAQDLAQEIFLKIYKEVSSFNGDSKLSTWIYKVSINTCLDWKRKNARENVIDFTSISRDVDCNILNYIHSDEELPEDKIIKDEKQKEIHSIIFDMSDIYKSIIIMYHFNNMSYEEIANTLNISKKTVETRLYRARKILKTKLMSSKSYSVEVMGNGM